MEEGASGRLRAEQLREGPWELNWRMVWWLLERNLLAERDVPTLALSWPLPLSDDEQVQLAFAEDVGATGIRTFVQRLAEPYIEAEVEAAIRCNVLAAILRGRASERDKVEAIAGVWADFGHPEDWAHLIYYMPAVDPQNASVEQLLRYADRWVQENSPS